MKKVNNKWYDSINNSWDCSVYTEEQAEGWSKTLVGCTDCYNCKYCYNCTDCNNCKYCHNCDNCHNCEYHHNCDNCHNCHNCSNCNNCNECSNCKYCNDCHNCKYGKCCKYCHNCYYCNNCNNCSNCNNCKYCRNRTKCNNWNKTPQSIVSNYIGSRDSQTTIYFSEDKIEVVCGCFKGTLEEFEAKVNSEYSEESKHGIEYRDFIKKAKVYMESE